MLFLVCLEQKPGQQTNTQEILLTWRHGIESRLTSKKPMREDMTLYEYKPAPYCNYPDFSDIVTLIQRARTTFILESGWVLFIWSYRLLFVPCSRNCQTQLVRSLSSGCLRYARFLHVSIAKRIRFWMSHLLLQVRSSERLPVLALQQMIHRLWAVW